MTAPLHGVRVLELARVLSGPHAGRALADLGADVIKIEPPEGDATRRAQPRHGGIAVYYAQQNCGKRSVSMDLRSAEGRDVALELALASDVVLENFRPGVLDRLGLGYDVLRARNPRVIVCSITGFGRRSNRRAYAPVVQAEAGMMELASRKRDVQPYADALAHGDLYAGEQAAAGVLAALFHRERTGEGSHVEVSMAEAMFYVNEWTASELIDPDPPRAHAFGGYHAPVLCLGDGTWVCVSGDPVVTWPLWCTAMKRADLETDERFATWQARQPRRAEILGVLQRWASTVAGFEALDDTLDAANLAAGRVQSTAEAACTEWGSSALEPVSTGARVPRLAVRMPGVSPRHTVAWQGEHKREVLSEVLGMADEAIAKLAEDGILCERPPAP